jgi:peptidoglycan/LPS O-acetylase OafA/YrhL
MKRIVRIYPAFLASTLLCIIVVAPLAGASFSDIWRSSGAALRRMILLYPPEAPNVFSGTPYADLNGAMWTINYEFRCYLLVLILGVTGVLRRPWILLVLTILCIVGFEQTYFHAHDRNLRLLSMFLVGSLFFVWRDRIVFYPMATAAAFAALVRFMFVPVLAEPAVAIFGSYVIFSLASFGGSWAIARINNRDDISYGLYLYAWPIEKLILWYAPSSSPWLVGATTLLGASAFGWLSWHGLEKPILRLSARTHAPLRVEQSFRALLQKLGPGKKLPKSAYEALGDAQ